MMVNDKPRVYAAFSRAAIGAREAEALRDITHPLDLVYAVMPEIQVRSSHIREALEVREPDTLGAKAQEGGQRDAEATAPRRSMSRPSPRAIASFRRTGPESRIPAVRPPLTFPSVTLRGVLRVGGGRRARPTAFFRSLAVIFGRGSHTASRV